MKTSIAKYYVTTNSSIGSVNLLHTNIETIRHIICLNGRSEKLKHMIIENYLEYFSDNHKKLELILSKDSAATYVGLINREISLGILSDDIYTKKIATYYPDIIVDYLDTDKCIDLSSIDQANIEKLNDNALSHFNKSLAILKNAKKLHDNWEQIYIENMNFEKAALLTEIMKHRIFDSVKLSDYNFYEYHRYFGASSPHGAINVVPELLSRANKRYFIKGRPGTGKSSMMRDILMEARNLKIPIEVYHCSADPNSLDMLLFPTIFTLIFDSTAPHEFFPKYDNDETIDMYSLLVKDGTDSRYQDELYSISRAYKAEISASTAELKEYYSLKEECEKIYTDALIDIEYDNILDLVKEIIQ